ncbi:MAG: glutamine--fructose-6-phosphate transaminase (isomerizing) [Alphaproteobacteria bacterium]|jgi:glucosamine--fructose-6-phosphate aminotransferase (isomerizing)
MCGIIGINSYENVANKLVAGLKKLEYRGYDSAGIACIKDDSICTVKTSGKVGALEDKLTHSSCNGHIGIAHTRWATHGEANSKNAHPHSTDKVSIVHNGIIENYDTIRNMLTDEGINFESDTDSEVILRLIDKYIKSGESPFESTKNAIMQLKGAFAVLAIFADHPNTMIVSKQSAPIAVSKTEKGTFVGSDAYSLASFTDNITYLENGDIAVLQKDSINIFDIHGNRVSRKESKLDKNITDYSKGHFKHYMLKEIYEQPIISKNSIDAYIKNGDICMPKLPFESKTINKIYIVACGTSYFAGMVAKYWLQDIAKIPTEVEIASEFRSRSLSLEKNNLAIFISQSGETADTIASLNLVKSQCHTLGIVNTIQSTLAREADLYLPIHAGIEIGVASTKAFITQLITLLCLTLNIAKLNRTITSEKLKEYCQTLMNLPGRIAETLNHEQEIQKIANQITNSKSVIYVGRGSSYPIALEGALKLKEISYIHAEGVAAGELKHGSIALIDEEIYTVAIAPYNSLFEKTMSNIQSIAARKGRIIAISDQKGQEALKDLCSNIITINHCPDFITPIIYTIPLQLLAYHVANNKNLNIDQPRNLAKSVTVE